MKRAAGEKTIAQKAWETVLKITVIGCGRWGSFIGWYLDSIGNQVTLYGPKGTDDIVRFQKTRTNGILTMPESIMLTDSLEGIAEAEAIVISVPSQILRSLMAELAPFRLTDKIFILCMKGIEIETGKRLSEIVAENTDTSNRVAVWIGPGHPQEFVKGHPNCMVIDSIDEQTKIKLVDSFSSDLIRFYYGADLIGNEVGAAAKNVIGIAAGLLDGYGLGALKGALMARGTKEVARLIQAMGGNALSAYGLCHLGDYEATVFSPFSHNRRFGEAWVTGEAFEGLAEGYYTVKALMGLCARYGVEMPISEGVYKILYEEEEI